MPKMGHHLLEHEKQLLFYHMQRCSKEDLLSIMNSLLYIACTCIGPNNRFDNNSILGHRNNILVKLIKEALML